MTTAAAGWYDDGSGRRRWWAGTAWTDIFEDSYRPPAGWYPDQRSPGSMRWWDGAAWGEPSDAATVETEAAPQAQSKSEVSEPVERFFKLEGNGDVEVVGESYHERELKKALRSHREGDLVVAVLVPETDNKFDATAVRIDLLVDNHLYTVGHLARSEARAYHHVLLPFAQQQRWGTVDAKIWRGHDTTQVYLRLDAADNILPKKAPVENGAVLKGGFSAVVTGEEHHQDVLRKLVDVHGSPVVVMFRLDYCRIAQGKDAGKQAIEVFLGPDRVGQLTRGITERYDKDVSRILRSGALAFAEGVVQEEGTRGLQVTLLMPAHY